MDHADNPERPGFGHARVVPGGLEGLTQHQRDLGANLLQERLKLGGPLRRFGADPFDDKAVHVRFSLNQANMSVNSPTHQTAWIRQGRLEGAGQLPTQLVGELVGHGEDEPAPGPEVPVQDGLGHTGLGCDLIHRHAGSVAMNGTYGGLHQLGCSGLPTAGDRRPPFGVALGPVVPDSWSGHVTNSNVTGSNSQETAGCVVVRLHSGAGYQGGWVHRCRLKGSIDRRDFVTLLTAGMVSALAEGCWWRGNSRSDIALSTSIQPTPPGTDEAAIPPVPTIPPPRPGRAQVVTHAPSLFTSEVALTIDDGNCPDCVAGYVAFAERTGIHLTFSPNGYLSDLWNGYADRLRALIEKGQVQIGNHTWSHPNLLLLDDTSIRGQIERNEDWIERTFGITARPWFRPPFGKHNTRTDDVAGSLGFTKILMWNGTLGDATLETPEMLMELARRWMKAGTIVLGHANHPTVIGLFDQLQQLMNERNLLPVTVDEMFGTSRAKG